ncbi:MAG TPA: SpoIIE family protein phosphatase [Aggregatilinea sp.]|uniref:SpoIIE family protein phosphatase n=1 Tax=Aggregatilinea sp. TaxID=2806333 RepID=UPI002CFAD3DF|nr:SpoIIE family protein phosphatase [Aggregatilinea sp.]HML22420.1 SpoIIE family protein phosphatase [Aggregatilinea sp.]
MSFLGELRVDATHENLMVISHFVHGIAHRLSLSDKVVFELELAVEEAATNIIDHAYQEAGGKILINAATTGEQVRIELTDWGAPLNPANVRPFDITAPIETRIQGGMGLHFIHTLMDRVERDIAPRSGEPNVLRLFKRIEKETAETRAASPMQELNAVRTISEVMTSRIDLDELLNLILNKLVTTINAERGTLFLIDEQRRELWSRVLLDDLHPLSEIRLKMGEGIAGHVAETGRVVNILDAYADPRFNPAVDQSTGFRTRSILAAPLVNPQQTIIGVVQVLNKRDGAFNARDERLLAALASQAAISIENARLYQQEIHQRVLQRELEMAHGIQASFLPEQIPHVDGWEICDFWEPVRGVAGDFYDFYPLEDGRLALTIADVSGKGVPAALFMALSVTVLRFGVSLNLPPAEVIRRANESIIASQRSRMFATVLLGYLETETGMLQFASAGHNPGLLYRAAEQRCDYITASGVAVGVFPNVDFAENNVRIEHGDILVLYTDGITEAINADEEEFGEERLEALLMEHCDMAAGELCGTIVEAVSAFAEGRALVDDATLVVIKRLGKDVS